MVSQVDGGSKSVFSVLMMQANIITAECKLSSGDLSELLTLINKRR